MLMNKEKINLFKEKITKKSFEDSKELPVSNDFLEFIRNQNISSNYTNKNSDYLIDFATSFYCRDIYKSFSFVIIFDEFIKEIVEYCKNQKILEICSGTGWLSEWIMRYGGNIIATTDNFSWGFSNICSAVEKLDAIESIKKYNDVDIIILSWPYMDDVAYNVYKNIQKGQKLLYIGEGYGGCNANDDFFNTLSRKPIYTFKNFLQWYGMHDLAEIYQKE